MMRTGTGIPAASRASCIKLEVADVAYQIRAEWCAWFIGKASYAGTASLVVVLWCCVVEKAAKYQ
jgi:hypothetical protein